MKTLLLIFIFAVALPTTALCQKPKTRQLTLEQLISLYNREPNDINDFLSAKGWGYNGVVKEVRDENGIIKNYGIILWAFNYNKFLESAEAWFIPFVYNDEIVIAHYQCKKCILKLSKKEQ